MLSVVYYMVLQWTWSCLGLLSVQSMAFRTTQVTTENKVRLLHSYWVKWSCLVLLGLQLNFPGCRWPSPALLTWVSLHSLSLLSTTVVPLRLLLAWASPVHLLRNLSINTSIIERFSSPSVLVGFILKFYFSLFLIMFDHVWIPLIHQQRILLIIRHSEAAPRYKNPQTTEQSFHGAAENVLAHIAQPRVTGCMLVNSCAFTQDTIFY